MGGVGVLCVVMGSGCRGGKSARLVVSDRVRLQMLKADGTAAASGCRSAVVLVLGI